VRILSAIMNRISRIALVTVCVCGAVACETGPRKSEAEKQADRAMAERVELALNSDNELYARHIIVRADNGVVRLSGFVWDPPDVVEAERIASAVQGVSRVVNTLELQRNGVDNSAVSR
jgi:osmotically-inducible protein OsmY